MLPWAQPPYRQLPAVSGKCAQTMLQQSSVCMPKAPCRCYYKAFRANLISMRRLERLLVIGGELEARRCVAKEYFSGGSGGNAG